MTGSSSKFRRISAVIASAAAAVLLCLDYLIPLYPYEWMDEPGLARQADIDSAFAIVWLSTFCLGLIGLASAAALPLLRKDHGKQRSLLLKLALGGAAAACLYRLLEAAPHYAG